MRRAHSWPRKGSDFEGSDKCRELSDYPFLRQMSNMAPEKSTGVAHQESSQPARLWG